MCLYRFTYWHNSPLCGHLLGPLRNSTDVSNLNDFIPFPSCLSDYSVFVEILQQLVRNAIIGDVRFLRSVLHPSNTIWFKINSNRQMAITPVLVKTYPKGLKVFLAKQMSLIDQIVKNVHELRLKYAITSKIIF